MHLSQESILIDFGCGIGRIAKALIEKTGCHVIGVDISSTMRSQAIAYVNNERFSVISPQELMQKYKEGLKVDAIICIWVLQHIPQVQTQVDLLYHLLKKEGKIFIVNNLRSALPTNKGWIDEGTDIKALLKNYFNCLFESTLPPEVSSKKIS